MNGLTPAFGRRRRGGPAHDPFPAQTAAYMAAELPPGEVLVRHDKLAGFDREPVWPFAHAASATRS